MLFQDKVKSVFKSCGIISYSSINPAADIGEEIKTPAFTMVRFVRFAEVLPFTVLHGSTVPNVVDVPFK